MSVAVGQTPESVSEILRGKRGIGRKHIEAFASYFHVSRRSSYPSPDREKVGGIKGASGNARSRLAKGSATRLTRETTWQLPARVDDDLLELDDQPPSVGIFADDLPASMIRAVA